MSLEELLAEVDETQPLAKASTETLLNAAFALTHRIHAARMSPVGLPKKYLEVQGLIARLRKQRDLIRAEILRRTGDL
jgi:hypothetical protein